ncbi:hypothetical protein PISMIDRAFT_153699 [Pisolithus microcarpus 441]|uniref:Uncharacterized protein n=1 Tax=Pisolithus microcarpus 441 TaxID=765257 RepID=A0A0C9ZA79_9AGAM|nr:hypothetical protein PISMIDRAFT_153699 [Pisolithus microcarpus 441]
MHADHVHCLPVVLGFIASVSGVMAGRWWWMPADHVHCLPVALGFIGSEWSHGRWWWMLTISLPPCCTWVHRK